MVRIAKLLEVPVSTKNKSLFVTSSKGLLEEFNHRWLSNTLAMSNSLWLFTEQMSILKDRNNQETNYVKCALHTASLLLNRP